MSLYEALFSRNSIWQSLSVVLGIGEGTLFPTEVRRLRDLYLVRQDEGFTIRVFTRLGGGNRPDYLDTIVGLQQHPRYIRDWDETIDSTYATFEYQFPPEELALAENLYQIQGGAYTEPLVKFSRLIDRMKSGADPDGDPELKRAIELGKHVAEQLDAPPELDEDGHPKPKIIEI